MLEILSSLAEWLQPEMLVKSGGFWLLLLVVFLETGIFFGCFLPGDSLLLTAGLLCGTAYLDVTLYELLAGLTIAGSLGSIAGYYFGMKTGDSLLFATGAIVANPGSELNIFLMGLLLILAAILGDWANYHIGKFIGPKAFSGKYRFLKTEYLVRT